MLPHNQMYIMHYLQEHHKSDASDFSAVCQEASVGDMNLALLVTLVSSRFLHCHYFPNVTNKFLMGIEFKTVQM